MHNLKTNYLNLKIAIVLLLLISVVSVQSQDSFKIDFKTPKRIDSVLYLGNYFGDKYKLVDTSTFSYNTYTFSGNKNLPGGIYMILDSKKGKLIEFLIDKDQKFTLTVDESFSNNNLITKNNPENELFNKHYLFTNQVFTEINALRKQIESKKVDKIVTDSINKEIARLTINLTDFRQKAIDQNKNTFYAAILKALKEVEVPDSIKNQSDLSYYYLREHFWDNVDLSDGRLLRTPLLTSKVETYLDKLTPPIADSVIVSINKMIAQTKANTEVRDYLIWLFTSKYQNPKIMGLDAVFVYLADNYFAKYEITNTTPSIKQTITKKADQLRKILIGSLAPDLWLIDTTGTYKSFKEIKADYTILFFWDIDCSICKKELTDLKKLNDDNKYNLEVYAIASNNDLDAWKNYIKTADLNWINVNGSKSMTPDFHDLYDIYATPVIYVLDHDKKIIAKRINAQQIFQVIERQ